MAVMKTFIGTYLLVLLFLLIVFPSKIDAQTCTANGGMKGREPPPGICNTENNSECCVQDIFYPTYTCSPSMTQAKLTLNSFEEGGDGGGESKCNERFYSNDERVVALSTGWYNGGARCNHEITINGNGRSVNAIVVDECDSTIGCDEEHSYQPPCPNNIVDASKAVWEALGVSQDNWGDLDITWTDA